MLDIRVDDLVPIAEATFSSDADWQRLIANWRDLYVNPRTCLREKRPRLCTFNACVARPASIHSKTVFRIPLFKIKCVHAILRFRKGCHNLPQDVGRKPEVSRSDLVWLSERAIVAILPNP